ncbi:transglutaminase-like domain-containing protein [Paenibacillus sp. 481]|uniref:transglutaminase-like domain-containing protein n=1 Tax=Paenibacillus sp. 481 TaxID=2835869 RepID=UPI001E5AB344|nr:transglutaminase family protein [Paenibacillus sp. 481]UHA74670.1 transglutaminase family protein [Paenibacillus sp. 481]
MQLICESNILADYLAATEEIDYHHLSIKETADQLHESTTHEIEFIQQSFAFVRDQINHSIDIQSSRVTCKASEVLYFKEGICYAKSNLLCAILRSKGIPTGFCYQRLTLGDTPDTGYCIHALNAVYIQSLKRWIRVDARGNKKGVDAQFSVDKEQLAFSIREHYGEIDYPTIYVNPNAQTIETLKSHTACADMYLHGLPTEI